MLNSLVICNLESIFSGNTFEGHTIIPVVNRFVKKHAVKEFTVVADAAMISNTNIKELLANQINYIVGARLGTLSGDSIKKLLSECKKITDARMLNKITNKEVRIRVKHTPKTLHYIQSLNLSH